MADYMWNPEEDGITHINIYSKGATDLGRWLTNFAHVPFTHPTYGEFNSIEALWYYASTGFQHEHLRELSGFNAKQVGKKIPKVGIVTDGTEDSSEFASIIKTGIRAKLIANPKMLGALIDTHLPLAHYYVYGGKAVHAGYEWIVLYIEDIRSACHQRDYHPLQ